MSDLGSLVVSLEANIVKFQSDLGKAAAIAEQRAQQMNQAFSMVKNSLATIGVAVGFGVIFDKIKDQIEGAIDTAAGLQQLSDRTGAAVEALSSLSLVAKLSGTGTDQLAVGLQKLSKSMIDAENGGTKTSASFNAIGISMADLQGKKPDQVFQMVAKSLANYQDGAEKVVVVQNLLGKSGADLLPVMKDLTEVGDLQVRVTGAQAAQADELEKNLVRLHASADALFQKVSLQLVPVFNAVVKTFLDTANGTDGIKGSIDKLSADNSIRTWAENAVKALGNVIDAWQGMSHAYETTQMKFQAGFEAYKAFSSWDFKGAPAIAAAAIQQAQTQALITEAYNKQRDAIFGANEALRKYQEDAGNKAAQIETALTNAFKGAEDAAVSFVTTGKASIKGLVDSVVADITRMIIKEQESKVLASISSGGGAMGLLGSLIGAVSGTSGMATVASGMGGDSLDNFLGLAGLAGAKASGGSVMGGSSYLVGEKGPRNLHAHRFGQHHPEQRIWRRRPRRPAHHRQQPLHHSRCDGPAHAIADCRQRGAGCPTCHGEEHLMAVTEHRAAEIDAMVADLIAQARPVFAAASPGARAAVMKEMEAGLERTYAVMLGQSGPRSEEAILIIEKIRDALTGLAVS